MRKSLVLVLAGLVACGGSQKGPEGPSNGGAAGGKPLGPGDVAFDVNPIEIQGVLFQPEALGRPGMPIVEAKKKTTLEKQRALYDKTKEPVQKQAQAAILATMLYQKAKESKDEAEQKKLYGDARQVLRDAATAAGDKVDEITLRLLGRYELLLEPPVNGRLLAAVTACTPGAAPSRSSAS